MKQYLSFLFVLLLLSVLPSIMYAQEVTQTPSHQDLVKNVDYTLAYPGLLPTSPLYGLKTLRDQIIGLLISDPLKKSQFDLLQADKRLAAGMFLLEANQNNTLAVDTISKGENYFFMAVGYLKQAKQQGESINDMLSNMENATLKHQQVLENLAQSHPQIKDKLVGQEKRVAGYENSVRQMANVK